MKCRYALFALMAAAAPAYANQSNCPSECNNPPAPLSFSYDDAEKYFNHGAAPTADQVLGNWINVASAELAGFDDTSVPNGYDASGLKNEDGSLRFLLSFSHRKAFDDSTQDTVLLLGLGNKNALQGPNEVDLTGNGACFAQWGYSLHGSLNQSGHYGYVCRLVEGNARKMICAVNFHADNSAGVSAAERGFDGRTVYYFGFVRQ